MTPTIDDLVLVVRDLVRGLSPNRDTQAYRDDMSYPPLITPLVLKGVPLDPFIRVKTKVSEYEMADILEDYLSFYMKRDSVPHGLSPREFLTREMRLGKIEAKWLLPRSLEMVQHSTYHYLVRVLWLINKLSERPSQISDDTLRIDGFDIGIWNREVVSRWFTGAVPDCPIRILETLTAPTPRPRIRLNDITARAWLNMSQLEPELRDAGRMALSIIVAGYRGRMNLESDLWNTGRRPYGKGVRKSLRRVAVLTRQATGNPAPMIYRELVHEGVVPLLELVSVLPKFESLYQRPVTYSVDPELTAKWSRNLRKLGG